MKRWVVGLLAGWLLLAGTTAWAADEAEYTRTEDVIYGRKFGMALTMDVLAPKKNANGAGVIMVISGGYFSAKEAINPLLALDLLRRGYTVFAVLHGSQPKFTVPEIITDVNRAVRFVRYHARDYQIDPDRLGIAGASAGGHLSLMIGTAGSKGDPKAADPVERVSSRVQAVACFFPPTDFLNWGEKGKEMLGPKAHRKPFRPAFDHHELDKETNVSVPVTDEKKLRAIARETSPITHVTAESAPTLIIHGDKDDLVPLQQGESMVAKLKEAGVPAELVVKKGVGHGWLTLLVDDVPKLGEWFDKYLKKPAAPK
jgi:acetyl esterase/lipase